MSTHYKSASQLDPGDAFNHPTAGWQQVKSVKRDGYAIVIRATGRSFELPLSQKVEVR